MHASDDEDAPGFRAVFATFGGPPGAVHALVLAGGVAVWIGSYVAVMELTGWATLAAESGPEAVAARRHAAAIATVAIGVYNGVAWFYAYGGPLLNFLVPVVVVSFVPDQVYVLFQPTTADAMLSTAGSVAGTRTQNPAFVADVLTVAISGGVGLFAPIVLLHRFLTTDAHRERFRERWPYDRAAED